MFNGFVAVSIGKPRSFIYDSGNAGLVPTGMEMNVSQAKELEIRPARVEDAPGICECINYHAERGRMLHRSLESVYDTLRECYVVTDGDGGVVGCVAVDIFWADLAEVKSLAITPGHAGQGLGRRLVETAIEDARRMGIRRLFALTYEEEFFAKQGFEVIDRSTLPEKVWRECLVCPKADACDEIAMSRRIDDLPNDRS